MLSQKYDARDAGALRDRPPTAVTAAAACCDVKYRWHTEDLVHLALCN